jgi:hypothetical protein
MAADLYPPHMDLPAQRKRIEKLIADAGLSEQAEAILAVARESVRISVEPATDESNAIGASRFGGAADLASADAWPNHLGQPLTFIGQIRLDDVAAVLDDNPLPATGLLSLFAYDVPGSDEEPSEQMYEAYGKVGAAIYAADVGALQAISPPYGDIPLNPVASRAMRFEAELCLPPVEGPDIDPADLEGDAHEKYWEDVWESRLVNDDEPYHRLLGHPDMNYNHHMKGTRLLFQLSSDDDLEWNFGDAQELRFLIPHDALASMQTDQVRLNGDEE